MSVRRAGRRSTTCRRVGVRARGQNLGWDIVRRRRQIRRRRPGWHDLAGLSAQPQRNRLFDRRRRGVSRQGPPGTLGLVPVHRLLQRGTPRFARGVSRHTHGPIPRHHPSQPVAFAVDEEGEVLTLSLIEGSGSPRCRHRTMIGRVDGYAAQALQRRGDTQHNPGGMKLDPHAEVRRAFQSYEYALFLLVVLVAYHLLLKRRLQNVVLLLASYWFYAAWDARFLSLIWISTIVDYTVGLRIQASPRCGKSATRPLLARTEPGHESRSPRVLQVLRVLHRQCC